MILGAVHPAGDVVAVRDGVLVDAVGAAPAVVCVAVDLAGASLAPVAAVRVGGDCLPAWAPPATGDGAATVVRGGHSVTGRRIADLDVDAVRRFAGTCGLTDFAVTATGAPVSAEHELAAAEAIAGEVPGARITLSYEFGHPGLRERERETVRNAALVPAAVRISDELSAAFPGLPVFVARTDEGCVSAHYFRRFPIVCVGGVAASAARGVTAAHGATLTAPTAAVVRIVQARGATELDAVLADAKDEALARVLSAGAAPDSVRIGATTVNPLSYLPDGMYLVQVTAVGDLP